MSVIRVNINYIWTSMEPDIQQIYLANQNIPLSRYMELYTYVYNCSVEFHRSTLNWQLSENLLSRIDSFKQIDESLRFGQELYYYVITFLERYSHHLLDQCSNLMDDEMLLFYTKRWVDYKFSSKVINGLFTYLNRQWKKRVGVERRITIYEIYHQALYTWRENLLKNRYEQITRGMINLFDRDRAGEIINTRLITATIDSFAELSSNLDPSELLYMEPTSSYVQQFEDTFLAHSELFYRTESMLFLNNYSVSDYLKHVEVRLKEEEKRALIILPHITQKKLKAVCERVLIMDHLSPIYEEFRILLELEKIPALIGIYQLIVRLNTDTVLAELAKHLEDYTHKQGSSALLKAGKSAFSNPVLYVQTILTVYERIRTLIHDAFNNDAIFIAAMNKAFANIVNQSGIKSASKRSFKSSENLAKYCHILLKNSRKKLNAHNLNESLDGAISVFKLLRDKDAFEKFYVKLLSKRLCLQLSINEETEALMVSKLKATCGFEYVRKLLRMLQDIEMSRTLSEKYNQMTGTHCSAYGIGFNILLLSKGTWQLSSSFNLTLPFSIEQAVESFQNFYANHFSGRKLTWLYNMSRGEVATTCFDKRYTIQASTLQMAVLTQFNHRTSWIVQQLVEQIDVKPAILLQVIKILINVKLLTSNEEGKLSTESSVQLNAAFSSKNLRVNINRSLKVDLKAEQESSIRSIENDRKYAVQATIVRIMKARQTMQHSQLVSEVLNQLTMRFVPSVQLIRKCIDTLMDKEYIQRRVGDEDFYSYVA